MLMSYAFVNTSNDTCLDDDERSLFLEKHFALELFVDHSHHSCKWKNERE